MMIQFFVHLILCLDVFIYLFYNHVTALLKYEYTDALHYTSTRDACYKSTMYFYIHYIHIYNMHTHTFNLSQYLITFLWNMMFLDLQHIFCSPVIKKNNQEPNTCFCF